MATHKIIVEFNNSAKNQVLGFENKELGGFDFNGNSSAFVGGLIGGIAGSFAIRECTNLLKNTLTNGLSRVGQYTGNDIQQMHINNAFSIISGLKNSLTLSGMINNFWTMSDYRLNISKQNAEAAYMRKLLLQDIKKSGEQL